MPSTVLSGLSPSRNQVHGNCTRISARDRFGFLSAPNRSPKSARRRTTKGRSSCSPARSASSRAGGTAATSPATTLSPACRTKRSYGSTGSGAAPADGICMEILPEAVYSPLPAYAELHCLSNFTFLRGASHPEELVRRAAGLGYSALAVTDECSLAGVVRAYVAAKDVGLPLVIGSEIRLRDRAQLVLPASDRASYRNLSELITPGRRRTKKGSYSLCRDDLDGGLACWPFLLVADGKRAAEHARSIAGSFAGR